MAHSFTKEQQAAIDTRDKTLLVSAAAGSGKTATLTQRIISSLLDEENPADISELLIVTFTNAAVGELKERIGAAIRGALKENPGNKRLEKQLLLLPSATICTIDSFCNEVLRANTGAIGIPPNYRIADAAEAELIGSAVCESLIGAAYEGDLADEIDPAAFAELCDCLTRARDDAELTPSLLALYRRCETHEDGIFSLRALCKEYDPAAFVSPERTRLGKYITDATAAMARHYCNALQRVLATFPLEGKKCADMHAILAAEQLFFYELSASEAYGTMRARLMDYKAERQPTFYAADKTEEIDFAIRLRKEYKEAIDKYKKDYFLYTVDQYKELYTTLYKYCDILCTFLEKFDLAFREEKKQRGLCEYADIERYAYRCLWDGDTPSAYARELAEKYSAIYIDEYQDVNRLQNLVFCAVARPNNRFMVGDIKQSIYSFRSADPSIFADMKNSFPPLAEAQDADAASIFMSRNFRCDEGVVNFVNAVFDTLFSHLGESIGYVADDRLCFSKLPPVGTHYPEITLVEKKSAEDEKKGGESESEDGEEESEEEAIDAVEAEARAIGRKILSLLNGEKKNDGSPIRPRDIAVIFRALRTKAPIYQRVFAEMDIPCAAAEEKSLLLAPEVLLCLCLLNAIDNPHRDVYLAGLLCSPLYGFTAGDLIAFGGTHRDPSVSLYSAILDYAAAHPECTALAAFLSSLERYRLMAEGMPVDALLSRLYAESSLLSLAAKNGGRDNLLLLREYAAKYEAGGFSGLYSFIHYVNNLIEKREDFDTKRASGDEDAVQLITVHASKGLEYPVCFIAGCGTAITDKTKSSFAHVEGFGLAFRLRDASGLSLVESPVMKAIAHRRFENCFEEELRILYVALTRARERLYIFGTTGECEPTLFLDRVREQAPFLDAYALFRMRSYLKLMLVAPTEAAVHTVSEEAQAQAAAVEVALPQQAPPPAEDAVSLFAKRFCATYAHAPFDAIPRKLSVSALQPDLLDRLAGERETEDEGDPYLSLTREDAGEAVKGELTQEQTHAPTLPAFVSGRREDESAKRGIATHLFLQFCDFSALRERGGEAELERLAREGFIGEEDKKRVRLDEIERFRRSALFGEMLSARALHREMRFHARVPARLLTENEEKRRALGAHRILVQGVIDCLFEEENGDLCLVDYKTDRLPREALRDAALARDILEKKHAPQLSYYSLAVEQMFGKRPKRVLVYSLHLGDTVDIKTQDLR